MVNWRLFEYIGCSFGCRFFIPVRNTLGMMEEERNAERRYFYIELGDENIKVS